MNKNSSFDSLSLEFSKFIQNFRTLNVFGRFLLIVLPVTTSALNTITHFTDAKYLSILNSLLFDSLPFKVQMFVL